MKNSAYGIVLGCIGLSLIVFRFETLSVYYQQVLCWTAVVGGILTIMRSRQEDEIGGKVFGAIVILSFQPLGGMMAPILPPVLSVDDRALGQFLFALGFLVAANHYGKSGKRRKENEENVD